MFYIIINDGFNVGCVDDFAGTWLEFKKEEL